MIHKPTMWAARFAIVANIVLGVLVQVNRIAPIKAGGDLVFTLVWALPAWLGVLASRRRPALLPPAALLAVLFGVATRGLVSIAFFAEAVVLVGAWFVWDDGPDSIVKPIIVTAMTLTLAVVACFGLALHRDTRCFRELDNGAVLAEVAASNCDPIERPPHGYRASDEIVGNEMVAGLALMAATLLVAWFVAAPRERGVAAIR